MAFCLSIYKALCRYHYVKDKYSLLYTPYPQEFLFFLFGLCYAIACVRRGISFDEIAVPIDFCSTNKQKYLSLNSSPYLRTFHK